MTTERDEAIGCMTKVSALVAAHDLDWPLYDALKQSRDWWSADLQAGEPDVTWAEANQSDASQLAEMTTAAGSCTGQAQARSRIEESHFGIAYRTGWVDDLRNIRTEDISEFTVLLAGGGPSVRIHGELADGIPRRAWLEYCGTGAWQQLVAADCAALLRFSQILIGEE